MKKLLFILPFLLIGCNTNPAKPEPSVVVQYKYVVRQAPDDMYKVPPPVTSIDTSKATQRDVATWVVKSEERTNQLENMMKALQVFFNEPEKAITP